jgi:hypothetical protein
VPPAPLGCPCRRLGCQASISHEGWAPSNSCHIAALLAVRPAPCSGFSRTHHAASAPCARGRASVLGPRPPGAVPVLALQPQTPCGLRWLRAGPALPSAPRGSQAAHTPARPGWVTSIAAGRASSGQGQALRVARKRHARQPGPRPPRCWPRSCRLAGKTGWAGGKAGVGGAPVGRGQRWARRVPCPGWG